MPVDLDLVHRYLVKALGRDHGVLDDFDDMIQEGMIRAWKDVESGMDDFSHVAHRAKVWARNFLYQGDRRPPTGAAKRSLEGRQNAQGVAKREKIRQFVSQYVELHGKEPTNKEISQGTGMHPQAVSTQRRKLRDGSGINHALTMDDYGQSRTDYKAYTIGHITEDNQNVIFAINTVSFENDLVDEMTFTGILKQLDPVHQKVLYWHHIVGYNAKEVDKLCGYSGLSTQGSRRIKQAHDAVKALLYPETITEKCRNGHLRTPDNTRTVHRKDGSKYRICDVCRVGKQQRKIMRDSAKRKPKTNPRRLKTHCKKNHEIRGYKKNSNRRFCKVCNYLSRFPNRTEADIPETSKVWQWDERSSDSI